MIFGGFSYNYGKYLNDLWQFKFESKKWQILSDGFNNGPVARANSAATALNGKFILFGGGNGAMKFNDLWEFDLKEKLWKEIITSYKP